jgi:hypothetical protein
MNKPVDSNLLTEATDITGDAKKRYSAGVLKYRQASPAPPPGRWSGPTG